MMRCALIILSGADVEAEAVDCTQLRQPGENDGVHVMLSSIV